MKLIGSACRYDIHLGPRALSVLRAVGVFYHGEFLHGVNAQQLPAGSSRRVVDFGRAREFDAVE